MIKTTEYYSRAKKIASQTQVKKMKQQLKQTADTSSKMCARAKSV